MTQKSFIANLDRRVHRVLARTGIADNGVYTAPGGAGGVPCQVYVDRAAQVLGEFGQVVDRRDELTFVKGVQQPVVNGRVFVPDSPGSSTGDTWVLSKIASDDGSLSRWAVRNV